MPRANCRRRNRSLSFRRFQGQQSRVARLPAPVGGGMFARLLKHPERVGVLRRLLAFVAMCGRPMRPQPYRRPPVSAGQYRVHGRFPPNVPCPCGTLRPNGLRRKWKQCHGKINQKKEQSV